MRRTDDPRRELAWLADRPVEESATGYDAQGWPASIWILHAMYENRSLRDLGSHDDLHRRLAQGLLPPMIIGDVNLDAVTTVSGTPLGFVVRPGRRWRRLRWADYLSRSGRALPAYEPFPLSSAWLHRGSWPISIDPPPEGSLDEGSLTAVLEVLADHSESGVDAPCRAFYASLPAGDFDHPTLYTGPLRAVPDLIATGQQRCTPTNLWPADRSWFVWTDWDLIATKISGPTITLDALRAHPDLETLDCPAFAI
jgi:hypothetical protein